MVHIRYGSQRVHVYSTYLTLNYILRTQVSYFLTPK